MRVKETIIGKIPFGLKAQHVIGVCLLGLSIGIMAGMTYNPVPLAMAAGCAIACLTGGVIGILPYIMEK